MTYREQDLKSVVSELQDQNKSLFERNAKLTEALQSKKNKWPLHLKILLLGPILLLIGLISLNTVGFYFGIQSNNWTTGPFIFSMLSDGVVAIIGTIAFGINLANHMDKKS